jgi:6-phosphogluconolactonase
VIELHAFDDPRTQAAALAKAVGDALTASLAASGPASRTTLAVSGGTSPRLFLQTLGGEPLEWPRIDVTLVDDRWVPETDAASNARLVRETLVLQSPQTGPDASGASAASGASGASVTASQTGASDASRARFLPLVDVSVTLEANVAALNADPLRQLPDVAVLGMGEDGHTASIFADAPEWAHAVDDAAEPFVAVHPQSAPHARVSLSLAAIKRIPHLFLLIAGPRKLDVLKAAASAQQKNAISKLANDNGVRLDVYWCAK